ncbi:hypothetical protein MJO28_009784 [Puccinia striiformis f. sp. tritici]|uniref:Uncharacterized protein n=1 Tax=Puccinia striiformis f. sp. tritici TaxID=168172 RepID=A0ACC0EAA7_9BASI|nr:hypothetical protein MJO28_009784 [Puccinia striiformis f. sp. tritici]
MIPTSKDQSEKGPLWSDTALSTKHLPGRYPPSEYKGTWARGISRLSWSFPHKTSGLNFGIKTALMNHHRQAHVGKSLFQLRNFSLPACVQRDPMSHLQSP